MTLGMQSGRWKGGKRRRACQGLLMIVGMALAMAMAMAMEHPAHALLPANVQGDPAEPAAAEPVIEAQREAEDDARIAERLNGIFAELPGMENVSVAVRQGVVTLSGTVSDQGAHQRAERIAQRVAGVVTVENRIERDLSLDGRLSVFDSLANKARALLASLPLLGLAAGVAIAIAAIGWVLAAPAGLWHRITPNRFLADLLRSALRFIFLVVGLIAALDIIGAGALMGAVLGGAGVVGLALGFAMRDTIENYVASVMLSLRQPFRPNDHVVIDGHEGRVIRLTSRATILMTLDGNHLRIPNGQVFRAVILNYTRNPERRFDFVLGIDADDDPRAAMQLGLKAMPALEFVLDRPEPAARIEEVGDSNIVIRFLGWIDQGKADWYKSRSLALAAVKQALEEGGFGLPEPIYRLRFDARTSPLPITRAQAMGEQSEGAAALATRGESAPISPGEVRPESEIAAMVEEERKMAKGKHDLLDPARPEE